MLKKEQRMFELKSEALSLIKMRAVTDNLRHLSEIIVRGIDDDFNPQLANQIDLEDYLRDRLLDFSFYPSMKMSLVIIRLADQINRKWEIKKDDQPMMQACLNAILDYQCQSNKQKDDLRLGDYLKSNETTKNLATIDGFNLDQVQTALKQAGYEPLPL